MTLETTARAQTLQRQWELIPIDALSERITIIGAGAIGSWVALACAKMGIDNITVYDDDTVSIENMNCQFFPLAAIGKPKVTALAEMVESFTGVQIEAKNERYEGGWLPGIVVSAVDSMAVRKNVRDQHTDSPYTRLIIDPRMGAETALLYTVKPSDEAAMASYAKSLYSDDDSVQERCTAKATIYTANMLAGLVCKVIKDCLTGKDTPKSIQWDIAGNEFMCFKPKPPEVSERDIPF